MDSRPVGFFDSGLGGASVLISAREILPSENYIYYGDNLNAPYGEKSEAEITELTMRCAYELMRHDVKAIVIACNTATATCIRQIRAELDVPVVSVEPAIKPACAHTGNGKILMMATKATTGLKRYLDLQQRMPDPSRVINVPCPGIVEHIEHGEFGYDTFCDLLDTLLGSYNEELIDGIVLGCTHYIFIKNVISDYAKLHFRGECMLYDGNNATAMQLKRVLEKSGLKNSSGHSDITFLTSGDPAYYKPIFDMLLSRH